MIIHENMGLHNRKCTQCGKQFEGRMEYAYKIPIKKITSAYYYFCSYKCMRAYEKEHVNERKKKEIAWQLNGGKKEDLYESAV